jgi:tetratricopeptide (TPR) repeat protein
LTSTLDLAVLMNDKDALGAWDSLSDSERKVMSSAYRRLLLAINAEFSKATAGVTGLRLLKVKESGETAEAVVYQPGSNDLLIKFTFLKRDGAWFLREILQTDTSYRIISENLQPAIQQVLLRRANKTAPLQRSSDLIRVLTLITTDAKAALPLIERVLKDDPTSQSLRHVMALALEANEKQEEAIKIWNELASEEKPYAPAILNLAWSHDDAEDADKRKQAIDFYIRYGELEPEDPRTNVALARLYDAAGDDGWAEAEHRSALRKDPADKEQHIEFAHFLATRKRFQELEAVVASIEKIAAADEDPFGDLMIHLYYSDDTDAAEELARKQPLRMAKSAEANLYLAYLLLDAGRSLQAMRFLRTAVKLSNDWAEPYAALARGYRALRQWRAALTVAEKAIRLEPDNAAAHFHKACALARLGRINEALKALEKYVEFEPDEPETLANESDLKVLAAKPAFKKLIAGKEEQK